MKKIFIALFLLLCVFSLADFKDVPVNHWAYESIKKVTSLNIMSGYPDGTFKGAVQISRYELATTISKTIDYILSNGGKKSTPVIQYQSSSKDTEELAAIKKNYDALNTRISKLEASIANFKQTQVQQPQQVQTLKIDPPDNTAELKKTIENYGSRVSKLESKLDNEINTRTENDKMYSNQLIELREYLKYLLININSLNSQISQLNTTILDLQKRITDLENK